MKCNLDTNVCSNQERRIVKNNLHNEDIALFRKVRTLVDRIVFKHNLPRANYDEYFSSALLALVEIKSKFDPSINSSFWAFAYKRLNGAVLDIVRSHIKFSRRYVSSEEGTRPSITENDSSRKLSEVLQFIYEGADLFNRQVLFPDQILERKRALLSLLKAIRKLPDNQRRIILQHYFIGTPFNKIAGEKIGVKKSFVSKLHQKALFNLRSNQLVLPWA